MPDVQQCRDFAEVCGQDVDDIKEANRRLKTASKLLKRFMDDRQSTLIIKIAEAAAENSQHIGKLTERVDTLTELVIKLTEQVTAMAAVKAAPNPKKDKPSAPSKADKIPYQEIADAYNEICGGVLPKIVKLTPDRRQKIKSRFNDGFTAEDFKTAFNKAVRSPFLKGENDRNWKANFDFFTQKGQLQKIIEGAYERAEQSSRSEHSYNLDLLAEHAKNHVPKGIGEDGKSIYD